MKRTVACIALVAAVLLSTSAGASAQSLDRLFAAGNEAYFRGDYARAAAHYERLVEAGVHDADVYFNLATAHARAGRYGLAVLYFERSLWLRAGDDAAEEGLTAARAALSRRRAEREGEATQVRPPLSSALVEPFSTDGLAWAALVLDVLLFAGLWLRPRARTDGARVGLAVALPIVGLLLVLSCTALVFKTDALREGEPAVVVRDGAELREGPDGKAQVRARAHEGESVRVLRQEGGHARVQLSQGAFGWISKKDVERIRPN